jgi:hypothetical protein
MERIAAYFERFTLHCSSASFNRSQGFYLRFAVLCCHPMNPQEETERQAQQESIREAFEAYERGGKEALNEFIDRKTEEYREKKNSNSSESEDQPD